MWGNPMREIFLLASGKLYQQQNTISSKGKLHLQHPTVPTNSTLNFVQNPYCCTAPFTLQHLENHAHSQLYGQNCTVPSAANNTPTTSNFMPAKCLEKCVLPCCTNFTDPYSTASNSSKEHSNFTQKISLGNVPNLPSEMHLDCCPFLFKLSLSQSLSIFFFTCLAHYPRHSLII
jgi:hypothetical protein